MHWTWVQLTMSSFSVIMTAENLHEPLVPRWVVLKRDVNSAMLGNRCVDDGVTIEVRTGWQHGLAGNDERVKRVEPSEFMKNHATTINERWPAFQCAPERLAFSVLVLELLVITSEGIRSEVLRYASNVFCPGDPFETINVFERDSRKYHPGVTGADAGVNRLRVQCHRA